MNVELRHYGTPRHSGRYPWGSGESPYQRGKDFVGFINDLRKQGLSEKDCAQAVGMSTTQLRAQLSLAKSTQRASDVAEAQRLKEKGLSNVAIGERMGVNESTVRSWLDPAISERAGITEATSNMLKDAVASKTYLDVGLGVESHLGISRTKLNTALAQLKEEGYEIHYVKVEQLGVPGKFTSIKVLCLPGTNYSELYKNQDQIRTLTDWSEDGGRSYSIPKPPIQINSNRIDVRYKDDGGSDKDGVIELRRGVDDISLGNSRYAQVRIAVDGTHYLKGMAIYSDDLPDGVDIRFNTNKTRTGSKLDAMKALKDDPDNPFGATIRQRLSPDGKTVISALNIVNEEGDWDKWSRTISSQVLSKQPPGLAKKQLGLAYDRKLQELEEIRSLTNPVVRKQLLEAFADDADSSAVHLKAAALPRQASKVILPINSLKETEVYAPSFKDGEQVVLIRHPHGGTFEIPQLTVNNRSKEGRAIIGSNPKDAIGINSKVAQRISGADFDGDTVIVIPNNSGSALSIKTSSPLKGLADFDPQTAYKGYEGMPRMTSKSKQTQMGEVSNLITDMTIKGASFDEIARAVRHSMVVIDAEKHNLNYRQSAIDNGIKELKAKYQGSSRSGAATLVSRAGSELRVPQRSGTVRIDPLTGEKLYFETGETYTNAKGKTVPKITKTTKMAEAKDAFTLSSGTPMETVYATHANKLKSLANAARKEAVNIRAPGVSSSAKVAYAPEVASLKAQLNVALKNKPMERQAQILATAIVNVKKQANPEMERDDIKKLNGQALAEARVRTGAQKYQIDISPREWEAIQAHAISTNTLTQILQNTNMDKVKELATPRTRTTLTSTKLAKAKQLLAAGYTQAEVADSLGVSTSTLATALR